MTLTEYHALPPLSQGYVVYMQAEREGSELKYVRCLYRKGTRQHADWHEGQRRAVLAAQDSEE